MTAAKINGKSVSKTISLQSDEFGNLLIPKNIWKNIIGSNAKTVKVLADNIFITIKKQAEVRAIAKKKKLKGEKYLESFYKKDILEIWDNFENGNIKLTNKEVDWGKPGNEVW